MAYKNQKKNKKHLAELKADPSGWRLRNAHKRRAKKKETPPMTMEEMEGLISRM